MAWICPILKTRVTAPAETIFYENDSLDYIYFLKSGTCNYVLPKYMNSPFIRINKHSNFGLVDFIAALHEKGENLLKHWGIIEGDCPHDEFHNEEEKTFFEMISKGKLRRKFTVQASEDKETLELLMIDDIGLY